MAMNSRGLTIADILEALGNSISVNVEYGVGIGMSGKLGVVQGEVEITAKGNTSYSSEGLQNDPWAFHAGISGGSSLLGIDAGGKVSSSGRGEFDYFAEINLPGNASLGWSNIQNDITLDIGASLYFAFGGGGNISINFSEYIDNLKSKLMKHSRR